MAYDYRKKQPLSGKYFKKGLLDICYICQDCGHMSLGPAWVEKNNIPEMITYPCPSCKNKSWKESIVPALNAKFL